MKIIQTGKIFRFENVQNKNSSNIKIIQIHKSSNFEKFKKIVRHKTNKTKGNTRKKREN
jgi:hypothetical protein